MLAILFSWLIISIVFITFGDMACLAYERVSKTEISSKLLDVFLLGMVVVGAIIAIVSLFFPANTQLMLILLAVSVISVILMRKRAKKRLRTLRATIAQISKFNLLVIILAMLCVAALSTIAPYWIDTIFYHIQNVMWNEEYSVVPGLGNMQPRFGFNSNYFLLVSTFGLKPLFGQFIFGVHTLIFALIWAWVLFKGFTSDNALKTLLALGSMVAFSFFYKGHISSISTDFLPNLLVLYLVLKLMFNIREIHRFRLLYFALVIYCITLKISMAPLILICLFILWRFWQTRDNKAILFMLSVGLLIGVPWLVRNVIISGYLIFPYPVLDFFDFDWKLPLAYAQEQKEFIGIYARSLIPTYSMQDAMQLSFWDMTKHWWTRSEEAYMPNNLFVMGLFIALALSIHNWVNCIWKKKYRTNQALYLLYFICLISLVIWFVNAPALRFMFGFVLAYIVLTIYILFAKFEPIIKQSNVKYLGIGMSYLCFIFLLQFSAKYVYFQSSDGFAFYKPEGVEVVHKYMEENYHMSEQYFEKKDINGVEIYVSSKGDLDIFTYDNPLPTSRDYVGGISMRGTSLQDGFRCLDGFPHRKLYIDNM